MRNVKTRFWLEPDRRKNWKHCFKVRPVDNNEWTWRHQQQWSGQERWHAQRHSQDQEETQQECVQDFIQRFEIPRFLTSCVCVHVSFLLILECLRVSLQVFPECDFLNSYIPPFYGEKKGLILMRITLGKKCSDESSLFLLEFVSLYHRTCSVTRYDSLVSGKLNFLPNFNLRVVQQFWTWYLSLNSWRILKSILHRQIIIGMIG